MGLLDGDIAALVSDGLEAAELPLDLTLTRTVAGTPDPDEPWVPVTPTTTAYPCRGFEDSYSAYYLANQLVQEGDRKIVILAQSLAVTPEPGDQITSRGETFTIVGPVKTDPARAAWECQARAA
jgi:hypothetical protein